MRRIFVILALLGTMFLVNFLRAGDLTSVEHFTLAAIGFVILAAFTMADLGASWLKLPMVTGYIITGIVLGPNISNILSTGVVNKLQMFNTLALGLIALNAGLELHLGSLKKIARTLFSTTLVKLTLLPLTVGGVIFAAGKYAPSWFGIPISATILTAIALIFAALSIGTSPSVTIAVSSELKAKGRLHDLILGAAIFKDLVVVVILAIVITICRSILNPETGLQIESLKLVAAELGLSILLGSLFGGIIILYVKYVGFQMLLFIFCLILTAAEISQALHAELLLLFITSGMVVRNFSKYEHDVIKPLNMVTLPTYIIFFTITGAAIDLNRTIALFPLAALIAGARALSYFAASHIGGWFGKEDVVVRNRAWLGYLPQAGVTLGLVGIATSQLKELSGFISEFGTTFVAINLLIGPLGLRYALTATSTPAKQRPHTVEDKEPHGIGEITTSKPLAPEPQIRVPEIPYNLLKNTELEERIKAYQREQRQIFQSEIIGHVNQWYKNFETGIYAAIDPDAKTFKRAEQIIEWSKIYSDNIFSEKSQVFQTYIDRISRQTDTLPSLIDSRLDPRLIEAQEDDAWLLSLHKRLLRFRSLFARGRRIRVRIPLRAMCKVSVELPLVDAAVESLRGILHLETQVYALIESFVQGDRNLADLQHEVESLFQHLEAQQVLDFEVAQARAFAKAIHRIHEIGFPLETTGNLKVSKTEKEKTTALQAISSMGTWGDEFEQVSKDAFRLGAVQGQVSLKLNHLVEETIIESIEEVATKYRDVLKKATVNLSELRDRLAAEMLEIQDIPALARDMASALDTNDLQRATRLFHRFTVDTSSHRLAIQFRKIAASGSGRFKVFDKGHHASNLEVLEEIRYHEVDLADILEDCLVYDFANVIDTQLTAFKEHIENLADLPEHLGNVLKFSVEGDSEPDDAATRERVMGSLRASLETIAEHTKELENSRKETVSGITKSFEGILAKVDAECATRSLKRVAKDRLLKFQELLEEMIAKRQNHFGLYYILRAIAWLAKTYTQIKHFNILELRKKVSSTFTERTRKIVDLKAYSEQLLVDADLERTTPLFRKGFSLDPLRDRKFFEANIEILQGVVDAERKWSKLGEPRSALIVGNPGSGKTSLLNVAQAELESPQTYRFDHSIGYWRGNLFHKIAEEFGCDPTLLSLRSKLSSTKTVIILDDLEYWFRPTANGIRSLHRFLELVSSTAESTLWLITVSFQFYRAFAQHVGLDQSFHTTFRLHGLDHNGVRRLIYSRLSYCGVRLEFTSNYGSRWSEWLRMGSEEDTFFRILTKATRGNLRDTLTLWIKSAEFHSEKAVTPTFDPLLTGRLNYLEHIPTAFLPILVLLVRHGPLGERDIAEALGISRNAVRRALQFLEISGQLRTGGKRNNYFDIVKRLKANVATSLESLC